MKIVWLILLFKIFFNKMEELGESELGTHNYWDQRYCEEFENFKNHGDPGDIWFGEDSVERVINWINKKQISKECKIIDIGCGNGMFLIELAREKFINLTGVDYSENSIRLAQEIAKQQELNHINYIQHDVLCSLEKQYDIIHDKGTYDAICLSLEAKENRNKYIDNVYQHLNSDGYFIITSCNWTKDELNEQFCNKFKCFEVIPTPTFRFGGKEGNVITSIIFKKQV